MANPEGLAVPAPEHEARFWSLIEAAWAPLGPEVNQARQALVARQADTPADTSVVAGALPGFLDALANHCRRFPGAELASLDRVLERKLWEVDRVDVYAVTGGSDDGFLYARGFIVAMGRKFYGSVGIPQRWPCRGLSARRCATSLRSSTGTGSVVSRIPVQIFPVSRART